MRQTISDDLTSYFSEIIALPRESEFDFMQKKNYVTYTAPLEAPNPPCITLLETRSVLSSAGDTGLRTWEAALSLGYFLCSESGRGFIRGKNIIELGAGGGFLSILCAKYLGAQCILATDGSERVVSNLQSNLHLNGLEQNSNIDVAILEWDSNLEDILGNQGHCDTFHLVLGADIVG